MGRWDTSSPQEPPLLRGRHGSPPEDGPRTHASCCWRPEAYGSARHQGARPLRGMGNGAVRQLQEGQRQHGGRREFAAAFGCVREGRSGGVWSLLKHVMCVGPRAGVAAIAPPPTPRISTPHHLSRQPPPCLLFTPSSAHRFFTPSTLSSTVGAWISVRTHGQRKARPRSR